VARGAAAVLAARARFGDGGSVVGPSWIRHACGSEGAVTPFGPR
jgi:hypothetical protein